jgi:hypothetical protein
MADTTKSVLLKLEAQFTGWKGDSLATIGKEAKKAQSTIDEMTASLKRAGVNAADAATATLRMSAQTRGSGKSMAETYGKYDVASITRFDRGLKGLAKTNMELALATQKAADTEKARRAEMQFSSAVENQLYSRHQGKRFEAQRDREIAAAVQKTNEGKQKRRALQQAQGAQEPQGMLASLVPVAVARAIPPLAALTVVAATARSIGDELRQVMSVRAGNAWDPEKSGYIGKAYAGIGSFAYETGISFGARNEWREPNQSMEAAENRRRRLDEREQRYIDARQRYATRAGIYKDYDDERRELTNQANSMNVGAASESRTVHARYADRARFETENFAQLAGDRAATPTASTMPGQASAYRIAQESERQRANQKSLIMGPAMMANDLAIEAKRQSGERVAAAQKRLDFFNRDKAAKMSELQRLARANGEAQLHGTPGQQMATMRELELAQRANADGINELVRLNAELAAATKLHINSTKQQTQAGKDVMAAQRERIQSDLQQATSQKNLHQGAVEREREIHKDQAAAYLAMSPLDKMTQVGIAAKLDAAIAGNVPQGPPAVKWFHGRRVAVPGGGGQLTPEEFQIAQGSPFLHDRFRRYADQATKNDPLFKRLNQFGGQPARQAEEEGLVKKYGKMEADIKVKLELDDKAVAAELMKKLIPQITGMLHEHVAKMAQYIDGLFAQQSAGQRQLPGGGP